MNKKLTSFYFFAAFLGMLLFPAIAQTPNSLPVVVDNRSGGTYHQVTSPTDFWTANAAAMETALEGVNIYPVFILPLGSGYYDFELKGSIDNYANGDLVYFFASAVDQQPSNPAWDASPKIYFTTPDVGDGRQWHVANPSITMYQQLGANSGTKINQVIVIPSMTGANVSLLKKSNAALVWSYCRISATGPETDTNGNPVWNVTYPAGWRGTQIVP